MTFHNIFLGDALHRDGQAVSNFLQEAILMRDFNHPNVLSLIGVTLDDEQLPMVIIPLMSKGDLKHVLRDESVVRRETELL